jgi:hypothetical protein
VKRVSVVITGVAVETGIKAVILVSFGVCTERTLNNLQTKYLLENPGKEFFTISKNVG